MDSSTFHDLPKRRRWRPLTADPSVPEFPTSHLSEEQVWELQLGYKYAKYKSKTNKVLFSILKEILNVHKISSLLEKPDESLFGFHDYYSVIEKPMWIKEISRKFADGEYSNLKNVIDDIKLILENFYKFWGREHKLIKQASRVERILQKHASDLPEHLKSLCASEEPTKPDLIPEPDNDSKKECTEESSEIAKWEEEVLKTKQNWKKIRLNSDLAEIGHFLRLSKDTLCMKEILQFEIERMLFIAKESTTLATIMTTLLCPPQSRGSLYFKPIMIYEVWHSLLFKKMELWYTSFEKKRDRLEMFTKYGIEPRFWDVVGVKNPMKESHFDKLPFVKKACILKTLCTSMFHSSEKIEEYFNTVEEDSLRRQILHEDAKYKYLSLFSPEIRVYRNPKDWNMELCIKAIVPDFDIDNSSNPDPALKKNYQRCCKFSLIASDKKSLLTFMKSLNKKKKSYSMLTNLIKNDQSDFCAKKGLKIMFDQWNNFVKRPAAHASNSMFYWIGKDTNVEYQTTANNPENPQPVLGKRVLKPKFSLGGDSSSNDSSWNDESSSDESVSDWEDGNIRRHRKVKPVKTRKNTLPRFFDSRFTKFDHKVEDVANTPVSSSSTITPCQKPVKGSELLLNSEPPLANMSPLLQKVSAAINRWAQPVDQLPAYEDLSGAVVVDMKNNSVFKVPFKEEPVCPNPFENALVINVKTGHAEVHEAYDPSNDVPEIIAPQELNQLHVEPPVGRNLKVDDHHADPFVEPLMNPLEHLLIGTPTDRHVHQRLDSSVHPLSLNVPEIIAPQELNQLHVEPPVGPNLEVYDYHADPFAELLMNPLEDPLPSTPPDHLVDQCLDFPLDPLSLDDLLP